jgi:DNA invertase Pin-like site-specific DNA recombinase
MNRIFQNSLTSKIESHHHDRFAVIYIRQSTLQQVHRHQESTRLQYGLKEHAIALGWLESQVMIIDEDLGTSGSSVEGRLGFQRLAAEVSLNHVGIVLGIELSRLARSCLDWHQLLENCAVFNTLIGDSDGIYDPSDYNDRLLLGLTGIMNEAELHILRRRMLEGKKAKARRGELSNHMPMGYVKRPSGEIIKDPDEQARSSIAMVFSLFEKYRTIHGVLAHLVKHHIQMPIRPHSGLEKGELKWSAPNRVSLSNLLHHPMYAGAYSYGRRPTDPKRKKAGRPTTGRTVAPMSEWEVLIKDHYPAYITWEDYEHHLKQLESNTHQAEGIVRQGPSLLSGILICGRCGLRMAPGYNNNGAGLRYACYEQMVNYGLDSCQSLEGHCLDQLIEKWIFKAVEPAALEISLKVAEEVEKERLQLQSHWKKRLERAHYQVQRAFRQYNATDPENRLVARTLEARWEESLRDEKQLQRDYQSFLSEHPQKMTLPQRAAIERLAENLPQLWHSSEIKNQDKQMIVRQMVQRVIVTVEGETEKVRVEIHWIGGHQTNDLLQRPVAKLKQLSYYEVLYQRAWHLLEEGKPLKDIALILNQEGFKPAKRAKLFKGQMIASLLGSKGKKHFQKKRPSERVKKRKNEWTLHELSSRLEMSPITLYSWYKKGKFQARYDQTSGRKMLLAFANKTELKRLEKLRDAPRKWARHVVVQSGSSGESLSIS